MKRYKSLTILNFLLFSIAIMLSGNAFAADTTPRRVTQPEFDAAIATVNSKISDITPPVRAIGDVLSDNSIVFWVDETGQHGLVAQPFNEEDMNGNGQFSWYAAKGSMDEHGLGWRLPTMNELNLLYLQKDVVGGFSDLAYWSSAENDADAAPCLDFGNGYKVIYGKNSAECWVRAVRAF